MYYRDHHFRFRCVFFSVARASLYNMEEDLLSRIASQICDHFLPPKKMLNESEFLKWPQSEQLHLPDVETPREITFKGAKIAVNYFMVFTWFINFLKLIKLPHKEYQEYKLLQQTFL